MLVTPQLEERQVHVGVRVGGDGRLGWWVPGDKAEGAGVEELHVQDARASYIPYARVVRKKAERCYRLEIASDASFITYGFDTLKKARLR